MQYPHEKLSDYSKPLHRGTVSIEEYLRGLNVAYGKIRKIKGKYYQIRANKAKNE